MLYEIYNAIKTELTKPGNGLGLKGVEWYNVQYESTITSTPRVFVEFPEKLVFDHISKSNRRTPLRVRLHVVTKALTSTDGTVTDTAAQQHESTATAVYEALERFQPTAEGEALCSHMLLSGWQHFHRHMGWMVTFVEFDARKLLA